MATRNITVYDGDQGNVVDTISVTVPDELVNTETLTAQVRASINTILASRETLRVIIDKTNATIGPADTKNVARELRDTQKVLLAVLRLVGDAVDTANTGPA